MPRQPAPSSAATEPPRPLEAPPGVAGEVRFGADGLVPAIAQDAENGEVLMLAWMSRESLERSLAEGRAWYWSRSRRALWRKGATSGNEQALLAVEWDCDRDALLLQVRQKGNACHLGRRRCFTPLGS